ncbi:universal stress protein [Spirulina subsalsa]|uniref:universal stress protein n=1 Tax=Spirulina subsalsa TaxID=54311 RepID=UPI0002E9D796|nr:universal stress protein [Spirulina subsalsa]
MSLFTSDRVLVPIDFSDESFQTQAEALDFVEDPRKLHIIHVLPHLNPAEPGMAWGKIDDKTRKENVLKHLHSRLPNAEEEGVNFHIAVGDPSSEIIDYAKAQKITLIVISSHGFSGLKRFLLGSVAERIVRHAPCPVLVRRH